MTTIKTNVEFGKIYVDTVTGFQGVATGIVQHQFGCIRIALTPKINKDGGIVECQWFDEASLGKVKPTKKAPGGPMPAPKTRQDPNGKARQRLTTRG